MSGYRLIPNYGPVDMVGQVNAFSTNICNLSHFWKPSYSNCKQFYLNYKAATSVLEMVLEIAPDLGCPFVGALELLNKNNIVKDAMQKMSRQSILDLETEFQYA